MMIIVVLMMDQASDPLRGELTRWLLETKPCVFVGNVSALVREKLWDKVAQNMPKGALLVFSSDTEQGFRIEMLGEPRRSVVDIDGIQLIKTQ